MESSPPVNGPFDGWRRQRGENDKKADIAERAAAASDQEYGKTIIMPIAVPGVGTPYILPLTW